MTTSATPTHQTVDLGGPTHYLDFGGPADGPAVVAVHGLGGAAWNWMAVAPLLTDAVRLLAIDLAGHGRTPAAGRSTAVSANRRLLDRFLREVVAEPVVLMGNSMGGMISSLEAATAPDLVNGLVLVDPALPRSRPLTKLDPRVAAQFAVLGTPGLGEAMLARRQRRRTTEQQVRETLALCTYDLSRIPDDVVATAISAIESRPPGDFSPKDFLVAARSLLPLLARPRRIHQRLDRITAPVLLLHGDRDRLVSIDVARDLAARYPAWRLAVAHDVGHVPMLEVPEWTARQVRDWLATDARLL